MTKTMQRRYRDLGERFQRSAEESARRGKAAEARRMYLSATREYLRVAIESDETIRYIWVEKADRMESLAYQIQTTVQGETSTNPAAPVHSVPGVDRGKVPVSEKMVAAESPITLKDVAGLQEVKQAVMTRIIYPFQHPEISRRYHKNPGGGILMFGPPGVGKTMIARAVAGEIGAGFFSVGCSDIFSKYVGETEKNMRKIFEQAATCDRAVLFLDEVEALLGRRGNERSPVLDRLVPEFLSLTDGVSKGKKRLLLLAATNRPWDMDEAALREGRFGQLIYIGLPDRDACRFILGRHFANVPIGDDVDLEALACKLTGYSGADIEGLCREATDLPYLREIETGNTQQLRADDLMRALQTARPSVTRDMMVKFIRFAEKRGLKI